MKKCVSLCALLCASGFGTSEVFAQPRGPGQGWSVLTGQTIGMNDTAAHIQAGWPGISATLLHGQTPKLDLGGIFTFNYGLEGDVSNVEPGLKLQGLARLLISDNGKINIGVNVAPGPLFYFGHSRTLVGFTIPVALVFGVPISPAANISFGVDLPFWFYVTQGGGVVIPILFGGGIEYFIERNMAVTFNTRMGPAIYTNSGPSYCSFGTCYGGGSTANFDLQALIGVALKL